MLKMKKECFSFKDNYKNTNTVKSRSMYGPVQESESKDRFHLQDKVGRKLNLKKLMIVFFFYLLLK